MSYSNESCCRRKRYTCYTLKDIGGFYLLQFLLTRFSSLKCLRFQEAISIASLDLWFCDTWQIEQALNSYGLSCHVVSRGHGDRCFVQYKCQRRLCILKRSALEDVWSNFPVNLGHQANRLLPCYRSADDFCPRHRRNL